jgi:hypothetical protein
MSRLCTTFNFFVTTTMREKTEKIIFETLKTDKVVLIVWLFNSLSIFHRIRHMMNTNMHQKIRIKLYNCENEKSSYFPSPSIIISYMWNVTTFIYIFHPPGFSRKFTQTYTRSICDDKKYCVELMILLFFYWFFIEIEHHKEMLQEGNSIFNLLHARCYVWWINV